MWRCEFLVCSVSCPLSGLLSMFLFGGCYSLIVTTSEFKSRGSGKTLAIWISRFLPLWGGIVWHGIFCIIMLCYCIMLFVFYHYWVRRFQIIHEVMEMISKFRLPWKMVGSLCKWLCKGASFTSAQCLVHLADFSLCFCLGGAIRWLLLHQNSNREGLVRPSPFEFRGSCHYGVVLYGMVSSALLCYVIVLCYYYYYIIGYVGFKLFTKSWKGFPSFDCPEKWLIHYVSYYVKVRVSRLLSALSI